MDTPGLWTGRRVCCISGCKEGQLSVDSGDGGVMTNALLPTPSARTAQQLAGGRLIRPQSVYVGPEARAAA